MVKESSGRRQIASPEYLILRTAEPGLAHYLRWYLSSPRFRDWIKLSVEGATGSHTRAKSGPILRQAVPIPPLEEQRRIVAAIEEQLSRLDQATVNLDRAAEALGALRHAALDRAATAAITTWGMTPVAEVCESIVNGNTPPPDRMTPGAGDIPYIKVYNLTLTGQLDFSKKPTFIDRETHERQLRRSRLVPCDVLINIVGPPLGKVALVPASYPEWNTNQAVVAFRPRDGGIRSDLLALWLMSRPVLTPLVETAKATAGQFNLSISACRRLEVPVPPLEEQAPLVAGVQRQLSLVDSLQTATDGALRRSAALRASILSCAFRGELVAQDPSDEPASALLERIANHRVLVPKRTRKADRKAPA
jgi:type I restriction enzyme S subunit